MTDEIDRLTRRLLREKRARMEAELLLETKSRELFESAQSLQEANEKLEDLIYLDQSTGLPNRRVLDMTLQRYLTPEADSALFGLLYILDLNDFNSVLSTHGHKIGDKLLRQASDRIKAVVGTIGEISKIGSDEFAIFQMSDEWRDTGPKVASQLVDALESPYEIEGYTIYCSASCGVTAMAADEPQAPTRIFTLAHAALGEARQHYRGSYFFLNKENQAHDPQHMAPRAQIFEALIDCQYEVWVQPQVLLQDRSLVGYEALARWRHPEKGVLGPHMFIPTIEHMGLSVRFGNQVLDNAFAAARRLKKINAGPIHMGVNLTPTQLIDTNLPHLIVNLLAKHDLQPEDIELEITEGSLIADANSVRENLLKLREMRVSIALDDFGTGYSSLSYLRTFPIDVLKIDRSFIQELTVDVEAAGLANAMVQMAKALGMRVIAEGIESAEQELFLKLLGVDMGQGYLFSKPIPVETASKNHNRPQLAVVSNA